jgi:hypothetical protein
MDIKLEGILRANFEKAVCNFDFPKVHSVMEQLDWKWSVRKKGYVIPDTIDMIANVTSLFDDAMANLEGTEKQVVFSGGFEIEINVYGTVDIRFIAEEKAVVEAMKYEEETL